jgi:hypothetical protein
MGINPCFLLAGSSFWFHGSKRRGGKHFEFQLKKTMTPACTVPARGRLSAVSFPFGVSLENAKLVGGAEERE